MYYQETLTKALEAIRNEKRKIREAGRSFSIPESTWRKQLKLGVVQVPLCGRKTIFSAEFEQESVAHDFPTINALQLRVHIVILSLLLH